MIFSIYYKKEEALRSMGCSMYFLFLSPPSWPEWRIEPRFQFFDQAGVGQKG